MSSVLTIGPGVRGLLNKGGAACPLFNSLLRNRSTGELWKVIEEKETWLSEREDRPPRPAIELRLWKVQEGCQPGTGPTRDLLYQPGGSSFQGEWEILFDA